MSPNDPDQLRLSAAEIAAHLAQRAPEVDRLRAPADESIRELEASGILSFFVPRAHGGLELDLVTYCDVVAKLGEGCTSTAWVASFYMIHAWIAALFPEAARREFFANGPSFLAPGALAPNGRARAVADGYALSGRWQWGTGVAHADWVMVTGLVERADAGPESRMFVLPIAEAKIEDTWFTDGMRGTASRDVIVADALVPEHRSLSYDELTSGESPGARDHPNPLYRLPMLPLLALTAALPAVGTARAAARLFEARMRERRVYMSRTRQQEKPAAQMRLARASVDVHAAWLLLRDIAARLGERMEAEVAGSADSRRPSAGRAVPSTSERVALSTRERAALSTSERAALSTSERAALSTSERAALRLSAARAVDLCRGAVRSICEGAGASAHFSDNPLQRMHRDLETLACHTVFDLDAASELSGRVMLGMDPGTPLV